MSSTSPSKRAKQDSPQPEDVLPKVTEVEKGTSDKRIVAMKVSSLH